MRHFYIEPAMGTKPAVTLAGAEAHHLRNVLRLKPGDRLKLFDGTGYEYDAVIQALSASKADLVIAGKRRVTTESPLHLVIAQAFLKEKKMDKILPPLCELGMTQWIPFFSERSVPRPDKERLAVRLERWEKIIKEAFKQCRRTVLPKITAPVSFDEMLKMGQHCELKYIFWEEQSPAQSQKGLAAPHPVENGIMMVLGPEGGFSRQEVEKANHHGFETAGLGPRILRAETATVAACALAQYLFGDMGNNLGSIHHIKKKGGFII
jgi:16S rRNA (uracil1498-N3)-methyltransferase